MEPGLDPLGVPFRVDGRFLAFGKERERDESISNHKQKPDAAGDQLTRGTWLPIKWVRNRALYLKQPRTKHPVSTTPATQHPGPWPSSRVPVDVHHKAVLGHLLEFELLLEIERRVNVRAQLLGALDGLVRGPDVGVALV